MTTAIQNFVANKQRIDEMLAALQNASNEHFGANPDNITWGDVGDLAYIAEKLQYLTDRVLKQGEFA